MGMGQFTVDPSIPLASGSIRRMVCGSLQSPLKDSSDCFQMRLQTGSNGSQIFFKPISGEHLYDFDRFSVGAGDHLHFRKRRYVADAALPIFLYLSRIAADVEVIYSDDTRVRILSCWKENKELKEEAKCLAHARRKFIDIEQTFPDECGRVLDAIAKVYRCDSPAALFIENPPKLSE